MKTKSRATNTHQSTKKKKQKWTRKKILRIFSFVRRADLQVIWTSKKSAPQTRENRCRIYAVILWRFFFFVFFSNLQFYTIFVSFRSINIFLMRRIANGFTCIDLAGNSAADCVAACVCAKYKHTHTLYRIVYEYHIGPAADALETKIIRKSKSIENETTETKKKTRKQKSFVRTVGVQCQS